MLDLLLMLNLAGVARAGGDDPETLRAFPRGGAVRRH